MSAAGRDWLIAEVQKSFETSSGYSLTYLTSSGNAFYHLQLAGVRLQGPGVELDLERLDVSYRLSSLFAWRLPLVIQASGLSGTIEPGEVYVPEASRSLPLPRVVVAGLEIGEVAVQIAGATYSLPDLGFGGVSVQSEGEWLRLRGVLSGAGGAATVDAKLQLAPFSLELDFEADARLARHYWDGIEAGTVWGTLFAEGGNVWADLHLRGGRATLIGIDLEDVHGSARYEHPKLDGTLYGRALGGEVSAQGAIDIAAQHWQAEVEGVPELPLVGAWLAQDRLAFDVELLGLEGEAATALSLSGWQHIDMRGQALGQGVALGQPLHALEAAFAYRSGLGVSVTAEARFESGVMQLALLPQEDGFSLSATALELALYSSADLELTVNAEASIVPVAGALSGAFNVQGVGSAFDRAISYQASGQLVEGHWQMTGDLEDSVGARLAARLDLAPELHASLELFGLELPWFASALEASFEALGPRDAVGWTLELSGAEGQLNPQLNGMVLAQDASGSLTGTLSPTGISFAAALGPLRAEGHYGLAERAGQAAIALEALSLAQTTAQLAVPQANLTLDDGGMLATGLVTLRGASFAPLALADLAAPFNLEVRDGALRFQLADQTQGLELSYEDETLSLASRDLAISLMDTPWRLSGALEFGEHGHIDLAADGPAGSVTLRGSAAEAAATVALRPGFRMGGLTLQQPVALRGPVRLGEREATLAGTAGALELSLNADFFERWRVESTVEVEEQHLRASLDAAGWRLQGGLPLSPLLALLSDEPVQGSFEVDLSREEESFSGRADFEANLRGQRLEGQLLSQGPTLLLEGRGLLWGEWLAFSGAVLPAVDLQGQVGDLGRLQLSGPLDALELQGEGVLPAVSQAGFSLAAQPWQLQADVAARRATLALGASSAVASWDADDWALEAHLDLSASWREMDLRLDGELNRHALRGALALSHEAGAATLALEGPLEGVQVQGTLPPALIEAATGLMSPPLAAGAELQGELDLLQLRYSLELRAEDLRATLEGEGLKPRAQVSAGGLSGDLDVLAGSWRLAFDAFEPGRWLADWPVATRVSGQLAYDPQTAAYQGELTAEGDVQLRLRGEGTRLRLDLELPYGDVQLRAAGDVMPELDLQLQAAYADWGSLGAHVSGTVAEPRLTGVASLQARELADGVHLPPQHKNLTASWRVADGFTITLAGESDTARYADGIWSGALALDLALAGSRHRLEGALTGALASPRFDGRVSGSYASGALSASSTGGSATLDIDARHWWTALGRVQATAEVWLQPEGSWRLQVEGQAAPQALPEAVLRAELSGQGGAYSGGGTLELGGEALGLALRGEGQEAELTVQAAGVRVQELFPAAEGLLEGDLVLRASASGWRGELAAYAQGELAGSPFALDLRGSEAGLELTGSLLHGNVTASLDPQEVTGTASFNSDVLGLALAAELLEQDELLSLSASGLWRGEHVSLRGHYSTAEAQGEWTMRHGASTLAAAARAEEGGYALQLAGHLAQGPGFDIALEAALGGGELRLLSGLLDGGAWGLDLQGRLWPPLALEAEARAPFLSLPAQVSIERDGTGYRLQAEQEGALALLLLSERFEPMSAGLQGSPALNDLSLSSNLHWTAEAGFAGEAAASLTPLAGSRIGVRASGEGALKLAASWQHQEQEILEAALELASNPYLSQELSGQVALRDLSTALLGLPLEESRLEGELLVSGSLMAPLLAGDVRTVGLIAAMGRLEGSLAGLTLALEGDALRLLGQLSPTAWELQASLHDVDLAGAMPIATTVSAEVSVTQAFGEGLYVSITNFVASELLQGQLSYDGLWSGSFRVEADLARFLDMPVAGGASGQLTLDNDRLGGSLELAGLRYANQAWLLAGSAELSGALSDPLVSLALEAGGEASGRLEVSWRPQQGSVTLSSSLSHAGLATDFWLEHAGRGTSAGGTIGTGVWTAELSGDGEAVALLGRGRLEGWRGRAALPGRDLQLTGDLASLAEGASGQLSLRASWPDADGKWLMGSLVGVGYRETALGDLLLLAEGPRLALEGSGLTAQLHLSDLTWSLQLAALELFGSSFSAGGQGDAAQGELMARVEAEDTLLAVQLGYEGGRLRVQADGSLPYGRLLADLTHAEDSWRGPLQVIGDLGAMSGEVSGDLWTPQLHAEVALEHPQGRIDAQLSASVAEGSFMGALHSPLLSSALQADGTLWPEVSLVMRDAAGQSLSLSAAGVDGQLELNAGPLQLALARAEAETMVVRLELRDQPGSGLLATLPADLRSFSPLRFAAYGEASGSVTLTLEGTPSLTLDALHWPLASPAVAADGQLRWQDGLHGSLRLQSELAWPWLPWLADDSLRAELIFSGAEAAMTLSHAALAGSGSLSWQEASRLELLLGFASGGSIEAQVSYDPATGPVGAITVEALPFSSGVSLSGELDLSPQALAGSGLLLAPEGRLSLSGELGWEALGLTLPSASDSAQLLVRLDSFNLADLPAVAALLPELDAPMTGVAQVVGSAIFGQVVSPNLQVAGRALPLTIDLSGSIAAVEAHVQQARSHATISYTDGRVSGFAQLEGFPIHALLEAQMGPSDVESAVTGLLRFDLPLAEPAAANVRFASERLRLERAGVVSEGELALQYHEGGLTIEQAEFRGAGSFSARGGLNAQGADLHVEAREADFGPLLGLLPALQGLALGARGSLDLHAHGPLDALDLTLNSPKLDVMVAGTQLELLDASLRLERGRLRGSGRLGGLGSLNLNLDGALSFAPFAADGQLDFAGTLELPLVGRLERVQGRVVTDAAGTRLESSAYLGAPLTLSGTLVPLDVRLQGERLELAMAHYYLHSSLLDADLRLRYGEDYLVSGGIFVHAARLGFAALPEELVLSEAPANPMLGRIHFQNLRLQAPQQVSFRENIGTADLSVDLTLSGTAAAPRLQGQASVQRGNIRFSGRDFTIQEAEAAFDPLRGPYPYLRARAVTTFEKSRVLNAAQTRTVSFAAPQDGRTFQVVLEVEGDFVETAPGRRSLRLEPRLWSDALLEDRRPSAPAPELDYAGAPGIRPLMEEEMLALLALGRLEFNLDLSQGILADGMAQTALDTVIDLYIMSELQRALGDALGLELFEIRTTAFSSLLEDAGSEFALSLRMGTYISDDVFATFSLGSYYDPWQSHVLGSSFSIRYDLSPLELQLSGGLTVPTSALDSRLTGPSPSFSVDFGYNVSPVVSLGAGFDVSGGLENRFGVRLGLDFKW